MNDYCYNNFMLGFYTVVPKAETFLDKITCNSCLEFFYDEISKEPSVVSFYNSGIAYGILTCQILGKEPNKDIEYEI